VKMPRESISLQCNLWMVAEQDGDDIKANVIPIHARSQRVIASGPDNVLLLFPIHGAIGRPEVIGRAGFHFDEHQLVLFPRDEIYFT